MQVQITIMSSHLIYLLTYFWLVRLFTAAWDFSLAGVSGGYSLVAVHGFPIAVDSLVVEHRL